MGTIPGTAQKLIGGQCRTLSAIDSKRLAIVADLLPQKFTSKLRKLLARNVADFYSLNCGELR